MEIIIKIVDISDKYLLVAFYHVTLHFILQNLEYKKICKKKKIEKKKRKKNLVCNFY